MEKKKGMYVSPHVEVIEMENEGVIALSNIGNTDLKSATRGYSGSRYTSPSASNNDLEDLINDILTVEN